MRTEFAIRFPGLGGMDAARDAALLDARAVAEAVNVESHGQMLRTRPGVRLHDLGLPAGANLQGAIHYNPGKGQSQQSFGEDRSVLFFVAAGRKYFCAPSLDRPENTKLSIEDVTGGDGFAGPASLHLAWVYQAENYAIVQDGAGRTWIWDGETSPQLSPGYNVADKEESKLANAATVGLYAHGRIIQVVNGRQVLVGDIIHKGDLSSASNILGTTEQVYWATGSFFSAPSGLGQVTAAAILPIRNTQHGHGEVMIHQENGVFSLDLNVYPRTEWVDRQMVRHALLRTGAVGPYALTLHNDGDQIFRSRHGIQTLRSAAAESGQLGNPVRPISREVGHWMDGDYRPFLRFASLVSWADRNRLLATVEHGLLGSKHRGGRGVVVQNYTPVSSEATPPVWEGLWTLPREGGQINQLVNDLFHGEDRCFAFVTGLSDEVLRLAEFSKEMREDVLPDGTRRRIEAQVVSRELTGGDEMTFKAYDAGTVYFRDVIGDLDWEVWAKTDQEPCWALWHEGEWKCADPEQGGEGETLEAPERANLDLGLGVLPDRLKRNRRLQLLVRWTGHASLEGIEVRFTPDQSGEGELARDRTCVKKVCSVQFDGFEYHSS